MSGATRLLFLGATALLCWQGFASAKEPVKIVSVGSRLPTLAEMRKNIALYEEVAPFDGIMIHVALSDVFRKTKFSKRDLERADDAAKLYKSVKFKKWKYNFLGVLIDQHKPDWFSDDYWKAVAYNWGKAASLAKRLGMPGICFDPEGYGVYPVNSYWKSAWWVQGGGKIKGGGVQPPDSSHTQKEYLEVARRRGREVGERVFEEFPEIVLWGFYLWSFNGSDLMGEFCNGLLETMPPKARLVDGDEWNGYCAKNEAAYKRMEDRNETGCGMLDKRLASKHCKQGGFAPAFYLDAYAWPEKSGCLTPAINAAKSKVHFFKDNFKEAKRRASGGHIWIYGEKCTWFCLEEDGKKRYQPWEEVLPGIGEAVFGVGKDKRKKHKRR